MNPRRHIFEAVTRSIRVAVQPVYLADQSKPDQHHYMWAYIVNVTNEGDRRVQLMRRHWVIADAAGHMTEVRGDGVVGEQPVLEPGDSFEYTSGTPLTTSRGIMTGDYEMALDNGECFEVTIPAFTLERPGEKHLVN